MIGMIVARRDDINEVQPLRRDDAPGHADVRLVRGGILVRQRIGEIRIKQQMPPLPLHKEPALAKPPEVERVGMFARGQNVGEERVVFQQGFNHGGEVS